MASLAAFINMGHLAQPGFDREGALVMPGGTGQPVSGPARARGNPASSRAGNQVPADEQLIGRVLMGDDDAFRKIYERYRRPVTATVLRILKDRGDAEDAVQEIFFKVHRGLCGWDTNRASFSTWLYRLAANHAIDCWRTGRRRGALHSSMPAAGAELQGWELPESAPGPSGPEQHLARRETAAAVRRCVRDLPKVHRKMIILRHFHGLKLQEIAELEGCNLATAKSSLYRAMQHLRRHLLRVKELWENGREERLSVEAAAPGMPQFHGGNWIMGCRD